MRHRRHTLTPTIPTRKLRATAGLPCVAALLVAALAGAAPGADTHGDRPEGAAVVSADGGTAAKSPGRHGTSQSLPSRAPSPAEAGGHEDGFGPDERSDGGGFDDDFGDGEELFGTRDLYEPDPGTEQDAGSGYESGYEPGSGSGTGAGPGSESGDPPSSDRRPTTAATGEVSPVLPLGAGMTLIGLGLALIALRLRRA
ncbi:hypothetical protein [Streptomyces winkii]|uniref:hypothetical protein n=1 Tax=Streptomyces winkii TaxID=3051178 RepID=UPI0028D10C1B|nr:hypothetical protein [Streptomyces sp. DSM 40971]